MNTHNSIIINENEPPTINKPFLIPLSYVSPFNKEIMNYISTIYANTHSTFQRFHPRSKVLLGRISDKVANYILSYEYYGKNSEWGRQIGFISDSSTSSIS